MASSSASKGLATIIVGGIVACLLMTALFLVFFEAPRELIMGQVQRIFYFHVASAFAALLGWVGCALASLGYLFLVQKGPYSSLVARLDRTAYALAEVGVLFGAIVLTTGPLWAKPAWGIYWTWEARLVLMLLTEFLFLGYLALRHYAKADPRGKRLAAGIAVIGGPAVYLIHVAVELWSGHHPTVVSGEGGGLQDPVMETTFILTVIATLSFFAYLVWLRTERHNLDASIEKLHLELDDLEDAKHLASSKG